jgi:hypothetical protein
MSITLTLLVLIYFILENGVENQNMEIRLNNLSISVKADVANLQIVMKADVAVLGVKIELLQNMMLQLTLQAGAVNQNQEVDQYGNQIK